MSLGSDRYVTVEVKPKFGLLLGQSNLDDNQKA